MKAFMIGLREGASRSALMGSLLAVVGAAACSGTAGPQTQRQAPVAVAAVPAVLHASLAFTHVRVFDGEHTLADATVLVDGDRIVAVGPGIAAPAGAVVVDGRGETLLPGLIDAHVHVHGAAALEQSLAFGVTTVLDMFAQPEGVKQLRAEDRPDRADLRSAGILATAPGGHGTEYGFAIPTLTAPEQAGAWVDARIAEGSDYIKIVFDDGRAYKRAVPTLDTPTFTAVVEAAHRRGKLAVVHIGDYDHARLAIDQGADGIVHMSRESRAGGRLRRARGGTPCVRDAHVGGHAGHVWRRDAARQGSGGRGAARARVARQPGDAVSVQDRRRAGRGGAGDRAAARRACPDPVRHRCAESWHRLRRQHARGARAAGDGGVVRERGADRGDVGAGEPVRPDRPRPDRPGSARRSAAGRGRPYDGDHRDAADRGVWRGGQRFDRDGYRARLAAAPHDAEAEVPPGELGMVSDFDAGPAASFGQSWVGSAGRASKAHVATVAGAHGSKGALGITGEVAPATMGAWAGAIWMPGGKAFVPMNLSSKRGFSFAARGDGKPYVVMVFARKRGRMPAFQPFQPGRAFATVSFTWSQFDGLDGKDVAAIFIGAMAAGPVDLAIDDFQLQ